MSKAADRLNKDCRKLYEAGEYTKLFDKLSGTLEDAGLLAELIREDNKLGLWWAKFQSGMWDIIFDNPELEQIISIFAEADGFTGLVQFQKQLHTIGFATVEDICRAYGTTPEEIERIVAENPDLFKGMAIEGMVQ